MRMSTGLLRSGSDVVVIRAAGLFGRKIRILKRHGLLGTGMKVALKDANRNI